MPCSCHQGLACIECAPHVTALCIEVSDSFFLLPQGQLKLQFDWPLNC